MTAPRGSAQAALLARIVASGLVDDTVPPSDAMAEAEAAAEAAAEGLSGCVERGVSGVSGVSGGVGDEEPRPADEAGTADAEAALPRPRSIDHVEPEAADGGGLDGADAIPAPGVAALGHGPEAGSHAPAPDTAPAAHPHPAPDVTAEPGPDTDTDPGPAPDADLGGAGSARADPAPPILPFHDPEPIRDPEPPAEAAAPAAAVGEEAAGSGSHVPAVAGGGPRAAATATRRQGPADPVRSMMHRHEELCAGAVDVLEIAAGLEARGVTDRMAARFRHRDVFSLADELYARVPHGAAGGRTVPVRVGPVRVGVLHVVPGAGCAAAAAFAVRSPAVGAVVALLVVLATWAALRRGPLRTESAGGALGGGWLLAFALVGGPLLAGLLGAPFDPPATAPFVALLLTLAPAAWCAQRFALRARAELASSRGLGEFAARVRPLLVGTLALYLVVLLALLWAAAALAGPAGVAGVGALGMLLFTARLLAVHGFTRAAAWGTGLAAATEAAALGAAALRHVPGLADLSAPVEQLGPAAIPVLACGCAAAVLVAHAFRTLTRASAHGAGARTGPPARSRPTDLRNPNQEQR